MSSDASEAWSSAIGDRPARSDYASIVREAQNSSEHAGDGAEGFAGLDGASFRHTETSTDVAGGGSSLGRGSLGSAASTAALTLHPCIHIVGIGDASRETLTTMLSEAVGGPCTVALFIDEETGQSCGEASATFSSAMHAEAAIRQFDGSRFDDGVLRVTVAQRAAQGSLTTRGRRGGGGGGRGGAAAAAAACLCRAAARSHQLDAAAAGAG